MRYKRIYFERPLAVAEQLSTDKDTAHYLATVLRCRVGDVVTLFNGGGSYRAEITAITRQSVTLAVKQRIRPAPSLDQSSDQSTALRITLACAIARGARMDCTIQKAVELGVNAIAPLFTERVAVRLDAGRMASRHAHWRQIIIRACEQCGRDELPALFMPQPLADWLAAAADNDDGANDDARKFIFSLQSRRFLSGFLASGVARSAACVLLLGPEGDFSPAEQQQAIKAGYAPVSLGPRILRTDTAVAAAITSVQLLWGDMRPAE